MPVLIRSERLAGIALMALTVFCFAVLDAAAKWLTQELPVGQVVWARYALSLLVILPFVNPLTTTGLFRTRRPVMHFMRAALTLVSTALNFFALQYLQLDQTISIMFSTPLIVAALAGPILGEWVGPRRAIAIVVGFLGVLIVTQPGFAGFHWAMILSLIGAAIYAAGNIMARILVREDPPALAFFAISAFGSVVMTLYVPFVWVWPSSWFIWAVMLFMGIMAAVGHWCLIMAHKYAPAAILAPFIYTQILWMTGLGWLIFDQTPGLPTIIGGAIVIASGLYLLWRERVVVGEVKSAPEKG